MINNQTCSKLGILQKLPYGLLPLHVKAKPDKLDMTALTNSIPKYLCLSPNQQIWWKGFLVELEATFQCEG